MEYISVTGKGTHKRNRDSLFDEEDPESLERHVGKAVKLVLNATQFVQVRKWVLQQQPDYDDTHNTEMMRIVDGSDYTVDSYNRFQCNGYSFSTVAYDGNKLVQNSGVSMKAYNSHGVLTTYYGVINGIFYLNYHANTIAVFYCDWESSEDKTAFKVDPLSKLVMVNLKKVLPGDNINAGPFILASQASQVFYCNDSKFEGWSVVIPSPKRLNKSIDALKIDPMMYNSVIEENERLCGLLNPIDG
ncbi:hypothetical protein ACHQM5_014261 [Ranunculus cassubicifolius]